MYIVGIVIVIFFAVVGISVFIGTIIKANMNTDTEGFVLLIPYLDEETAEARIRSAAAIYDSERSFRVVCICRSNPNVRQICEKLRIQYPYLEIVDSIDEV